MGLSGRKEAVSLSDKVCVGAHPWVYAARQPRYDVTPILEQIFADIKSAGVDGIELIDTALRYEDAVERIGKLSQEYGLPIIGTSFGGDMWDRSQHQLILKDAERVVMRLSALGGHTLGTSVGVAPDIKTDEQLDAQAEILREIMALCDANGITLNIHNHTYEVVHNEYDLKGTIERIPDIKLGPDLNWLLRGGVDPVDFIRRYSDRIVFLHLRDQNADGTWFEALGEGEMDYYSIGRVLRDINFSGEAVIELAHESGFEPTRPLRESLKMSREFVRNTLGY